MNSFTGLSIPFLPSVPVATYGILPFIGQSSLTYCLPSVRGDRGRRGFRCPWSEDSTMYTSLDIEKHGRVVVEDIVKLLLVQFQPLTGETQAT